VLNVDPAPDMDVGSVFHLLNTGRYAFLKFSLPQNVIPHCSGIFYNIFRRHRYIVQRPCWCLHSLLL